MITTLRGLDTVLPLPEKKTPIVSQKPKKTKKPKHIVYESPYLEPQVKPVWPKSTPYPPIPIPDPCFQPYDQYSDPAFVVENERTRFYGSNQEVTPCGCNTVNKPMILQQYCPINHTPEEHQEYAVRLFDEFVRATYCHCVSGHKTASVMDQEIVHYAQLELAKTNDEFISILKAYIGQVVVREIMKLLLNADPTADDAITNLFYCINCKKCQNDVAILGNLWRQSNQTKRVIQPYEAQILFSIFGNDGPTGLLKTFNNIAKDRKQIVHACVKDIWKTDLFLWSDCQAVDHAVEFECDSDMEADPDPRNDKLMSCMLAKALNTLRDDPKYVIPHLPNAYKLPLLNQWIRVRYGIKYSRKERTDLLKQSIKRWRFMERQGKQKIPVPKPNDVCERARDLNQGHFGVIDKCVSYFSVIICQS